MARGRGLRTHGRSSVRGRTSRGRPRKSHVRGGMHTHQEHEIQARDPLAWKWEKIDTPNQVINLEDLSFTGEEGLRVRMKENATPLDYIELYLTDEIMELLVTETNRYAKQFIVGKEKNTYLHQWTNVTVNEMKQFIGILILMGIVHKPQIHMYWSKSGLLSTPVFGNIMRRDQLFIIKIFSFQ